MAREKDKRQLHRYSITLKLREGTDDDLINLLADTSNKALLIKRALRGAGIDPANQAKSESTEDILDDLIF